jgi:hypothetical protein
MTVQRELAENRGLTPRALVKPLVRAANFFKHADRDATEVLDFDEEDAVIVLELACHDFGRVTGGMPVEAQVYEAWATAIAFGRVSDAPLKSQDLIKRVIKLFPGIRSADRAEQKRIGLNVLTKAATDPSLQMKIRREVT